MIMKENLLTRIEMQFTTSLYIMMLRNAKISRKSWIWFERANNYWVEIIIIECHRPVERRLWGRVLRIYWLSRENPNCRIVKLWCRCMLIREIKIIVRLIHKDPLIGKIWVRITCQSWTQNLFKPAE